MSMPRNTDRDGQRSMYRARPGLPKPRPRLLPLRLLPHGPHCRLVRSGLTGLFVSRADRMQLMLIGFLLATAIGLMVLGLVSGLSTNIETVRTPGGETATVGCGSPWVPNYDQAERAGQGPLLGSEVVDACRNHNDSEALLATAAAPGGLVVAVTAACVAFVEVRDARRRTDRARQAQSTTTDRP